MGQELSDTDKMSYKLIDDYFYQQILPKKYWGSDGEEMKFDKDFETNCTVMAQHLSVAPKSMTVLEYMNAFEQLNKQFSAKN